MSCYRGLTKAERAQLRDLNQRIETLRRIMAALVTQRTMIMRHVPPRKRRRSQPDVSTARSPAAPKQSSLF
jgi:hypothetical protein